jgi:hypothetical protein
MDDQTDELLRGCLAEAILRHSDAAR